MDSSLQKVIERVRSADFIDSDWLFIAGTPEHLTLGTDADLGTVDFDCCHLKFWKRNVFTCFKVRIPQPKHVVLSEPTSREGV